MLRLKEIESIYKIYQIESPGAVQEPVKSPGRLIHYNPSAVGSDDATPLADILKENKLLQTIVAIRYASPFDQGFSFPILRPNLADIMLNTTMLHLQRIFAYVDILADTDTGAVVDVICGPMKARAREEFCSICEQKLLHRDLTAFFPGYQNAEQTGDKTVVYRAHTERDFAWTLSDAQENPIVQYLLWSMSLFQIPLCELPYRNRTIEAVQSDVFLEKIAAVAQESYITGSDCGTVWKSETVFFKYLHPRAELLLKALVEGRE